MGGALLGRGREGGGGASPSQSASSERSWQSASPSQRSLRSTHWPRAQGNCEAEHTGQPSSSLWSSHSGKPSQRQAPGMQSISPVAQANWSGEHVGGSAEQRKTIMGAGFWAKVGRSTSGFQSGEYAQFIHAVSTSSPLPCVLSAFPPPAQVGHEAVDPKHRVCAGPGYTSVSTAPPPEVEGSESQWSAPTPITH